MTTQNKTMLQGRIDHLWYQLEREENELRAWKIENTILRLQDELVYPDTSEYFHMEVV